MTRPSSARPGSRARERRARVWFVGAGPGAPDLITVRGARLIRDADLVLYAGSLVPRSLLDEIGLHPAAQAVDTASLTLDETHGMCREAVHDHRLVVRLHTGDPSLYGTLREQVRLLDRDGIPWSVVPGVTAAFAAAASAGVSLTAPEITQSVILTRLEGRTPVPERENLQSLAAHGCSLAVYLSARQAPALQEALRVLPDDTPVLCACRVGWPDERIVPATTGSIAQTVMDHGLDRQTVFLILPGEKPEAPLTASKLYDPDFRHAFRP